MSSRLFMRHALFLGVALLIMGGAAFAFLKVFPPPAEEIVLGGSMIPAASLVRTYAASELGVERAQVVVITTVSKEWPDGCLGLAGEDEMCTQALVPGYEVVVEVLGERHTYRTNVDGTVIRPQDAPKVEEEI